MHTSREVELFRQLLQRWAYGFETLVTSVLALRANDGSWVLSRALRVFLVGGVSITPIEIRTQSILASRRVTTLDRNTLESLIETVLTDPFSVELEGEKLEALPCDEGSMHTQFQPFHPRLASQNRRVCGLRAVVPFSQALPDRQALDLELAAHCEPYDGLNELLTNLDLNFDEEELTRETIIEILAWPPAVIDQESSLAGGKIDVRLILSGSGETKEIRLGLKVFKQPGPPIRRSVDGPTLEWTKQDGYWRGHYRSSEDSETHLVKVFLSYKGDHLSHWWIRDNARQINERLSIHNTIDEGKLFSARFFEKESQFCEKVSTLLNLFGLTIWKCDASAPAGNVPDLIAMTATRHLFIIECTVGDVDRSGKLQRLRNRTDRIASRLRDLDVFLNAPPLPVMVTSLSRGETRAHWRTAETLGIALVCRSEIEHLLGRLEFPYSGEQLFQEALSCIPSSVDAASSSAR